MASRRTPTERSIGRHQKREAVKMFSAKYRTLRKKSRGQPRPKRGPR